MRQLGETLTGHQSDTSTIRTTHASARVRCRHVGEGGDSGSGDCLDAFRTDARTFSRPAISHLPPAGQLGSSNSESAARPRHRGAALSTLVYVSDCLLVSRPPAIHRQLPPPMNSSRQRYSVCSETPARRAICSAGSSMVNRRSTSCVRSPPIAPSRGQRNAH